MKIMSAYWRNKSVVDDDVDDDDRKKNLGLRHIQNCVKWKWSDKNA